MAMSEEVKKIVYDWLNPTKKCKEDCHIFRWYGTAINQKHGKVVCLCGKEVIYEN